LLTSLVPVSTSPRHAVFRRLDTGRLDHSAADTLPVPQFATVYQRSQGCRQQD
jgi:hypothetical protein